MRGLLKGIKVIRVATPSLPEQISPGACRWISPCETNGGMDLFRAAQAAYGRMTGRDAQSGAVNRCKWVAASVGWERSRDSRRDNRVDNPHPHTPLAPQCPSCQDYSC